MALLGYGLALAIGVVLGALGGGGAVLTVPVLLYVFGFGMKVAVPMSLVVVGITSLFGVWRYHRIGEVGYRTALVFGPAAMVGAVGGSAAALRVSSGVQVTVFAVLLLAAAVLMLVRKEPAAGSRVGHPMGLLGLVGAAVGFLTGFVGVGGGFMYVPALVLLAGLPMRRAVGTSLVLIVLSCAAGVAGYLGRVDLAWPVVAGFTALAMAGVAIGSSVAARLPQQTLRRAFAVLLLLMGIFVLVRGEGPARQAWNGGEGQDAVSTVL